MPQKPARRHVIANIRLECGLSQGELAELLGYKKVTVQKIEQGQMQMSEDLAEKVQEQLDVSAEYLLENDLNREPVTPRGGKWTKELFEFAQGARSVVTERKPGGKTRLRTRIDSPPSVEPGTRRIRPAPSPLEGAKAEYTAWKVMDCTRKIHALIAGTEGSPSQGILLYRLNIALNKLMEQFPADQSVLASYEAKLEKLRLAYDKVTEQTEEAEHARIWRQDMEESQKI